MVNYAFFPFIVHMAYKSQIKNPCLVLNQFLNFFLFFHQIFIVIDYTDIAIDPPELLANGAS